MKITPDTPVVGASDDDARPDAPPGPATQRLQRSRGRPPKTAPTDGQMTLTGEVVAYVDPPSRSPWAEPNPELDDLQADDVEAVAEAAAEIVTADLDAELAELTPDADGHLFSQFVNRRSMGMLTDLTPSERLMFVGHSLAMGPASSHHWPLESVGALVGVSLSAATRATGTLVKLGVLVRKDRGRIDAMTTRPAEFRFGDAVLQSTARVSDQHTGDEIQTECPTCMSDEHTGTRMSDEHTVESSKDLSLASGSENRPREPRPSWVAEDAECDTCGGPVTTNPNTGRPNERCKGCYSSAKTERATAEVTALDHLAVMRSLMGAGWGNRYATPGSGPDQADLLRRFGGDEAAVKAAQSLRFRFGAMTDREAGPAWRAAYAEAGGRP